MSEDIREMVELAAVALGLKGRALERMEKRGRNATAARVAATAESKQ